MGLQEAGSLHSRSAEATHELGRCLGELLAPGDVVGLSGPLGAGKTCLVQGVARGLGIPDETPITSPTFGIVSEYPGRVWLRHADFYRVEHYQRLLDAGFDDVLDGRAAVLVEWAERFPEALPEQLLWIEIELGADGDRLIVLRACGERARELARAFFERATEAGLR